MKQRDSNLIWRIAAILLCLAFITNGTAGYTMAKYTWSKTDYTFYISYSENAHTAIRDNMPSGYYAFYLSGAGGGKSSASNTGAGGTGGSCTGIFYTAGSVSYAVGSGGSTNVKGATGGGYSTLTVDGAIIAIAGGGGGSSDDSSGIVGGAKPGGAGGNVAWGAATTGNYRVGNGASSTQGDNANGKGGTTTRGAGGTGSGLGASNGNNGSNPNGLNGANGGTPDGNRGGGGGGYAGGGSGAWSFGGLDGAGGGGSSAIDVTKVIAAAPSGIPNWPSGSAGGTQNGFCYIYYIGPILQANKPPYNNFVPVS